MALARRRRRHRILSRERLDQCLAVEVEARKLMRRKFDIDYLILRTKNIDFRDVGHC